MRQCFQITLAVTPRTKKNSQRMVQSKTTKRWFPIPSDAYKKYEKDCLQILRLAGPVEPISSKVNVRCWFYMPTTRPCDLTNLLEAVDDILVKGMVIADDNYNIVAGHDGSRVFVDKENPRTEILIEEIDDA